MIGFSSFYSTLVNNPNKHLINSMHINQLIVGNIQIIRDILRGEGFEKVSHKHFFHTTSKKIFKKLKMFEVSHKHLELFKHLFLTCYAYEVNELKKNPLNSLIDNLLRFSTQFSPNFIKLKSSTSRSARLIKIHLNC